MTGTERMESMCLMYWISFHLFTDNYYYEPFYPIKVPPTSCAVEVVTDLCRGVVRQQGAEPGAVSVVLELAHIEVPYRCVHEADPIGPAAP